MVKFNALVFASLMVTIALLSDAHEENIADDDGRAGVLMDKLYADRMSGDLEGKEKLSRHKRVFPISYTLLTLGSLWIVGAFRDKDFGSIATGLVQQKMNGGVPVQQQRDANTYSEVPEVSKQYTPPSPPKVSRKNRKYSGSTKLSEETNDNIKALQSKLRILQQKLLEQKNGKKIEDLVTQNLENSLDDAEDQIEEEPKPKVINEKTIKKEKSEVLEDDRVQVLFQKVRTQVEIKFNGRMQRSIWIPKPPNQVSLNDVQNYLMKTPERLGILAGKMAMFSVKTDENNYDDIHEEDLGDNLPLFDGKIVLECWLI